MDDLKELFFQWSRQVENTIACYFCYKIITDEDIYSCESGHNICSTCKFDKCLVELCVACTVSKSIVHNQLAGQLVKLFIDLKNEAIKIKWPKIESANEECAEDTLKDKEDHVDVDKISEVDLGESSDKSFSANTSEADDISDIPPGFYPCLNKFCKFVGSYIDIISHYENNHSSQYEQNDFNGFPLTKNWELNYSGNNSQVIRVFDVRKVGSFVLHIYFNNDSEMKAGVLLYNVRKNAMKYQYNIEIKCDGKEKTESLVVNTCRLPEKILFDSKNGLFIGKDSILYRSIITKLQYTCTIQLEETNEPEFLPLSNAQNIDVNKKYENKRIHTPVKNYNRPKIDNKQKNDNKQKGDGKYKSDTKQQNCNKSKSDNNKQRPHHNAQDRKSAKKNTEGNKNAETCIPSLLTSDFTLPSPPNSLNNNEPSLRQSQSMHQNIAPSITPQMPSGLQFSPMMTNPYVNVPPQFLHSPPPPMQHDLINMVYQPSVPAYVHPAHYVHHPIPSSSTPNLNISDHRDRQQNVKADVKAKQGAYLYKHEVNTANTDDTKNVPRENKNRNNRSRRSRDRDSTENNCTLS